MFGSVIPAADADAYDVIVCGGTLGLLPALALQRRGWRVAVVERRLAEGRTQEWNSSRAEMQVGVVAHLLGCVVGGALFV